MKGNPKNEPLDIDIARKMIKRTCQEWVEEIAKITITTKDYYPEDMLKDWSITENEWRDIFSD